jgi:hypothetical protein
MEKIKKYLIAPAIYFILIFLVYYFRLGGEQFDSITLVISVVTPLITILFGYIALRYFSIRTSQGKCIFFLVLASVFWLLGDFIWDYIDSNVVSAADYFYWIGYILVVVAMFFGVRVINPLLLNDKKKVGIVLAILLVFTSVYFNFFPLIWDSEISLRENIGTYAYIIADLLILLSAMFLLFFITSGSYKIPWILIAIGTLLDWIGDAYYALNYETYSVTDLVDTTWLLSYLLWAAAFILMKHNAQKALELSKKNFAAHKKS